MAMVYGATAKKVANKKEIHYNVFHFTSHHLNVKVFNMEIVKKMNKSLRGSHIDELLINYDDEVMDLNGKAPMANAQLRRIKVNAKEGSAQHKQSSGPDRSVKREAKRTFQV